MKVLFAGPSIFGLDLDLTGIELRGPAEMGDLERAVDDGAAGIGLIDGHYQQVGAVWHKEILYALSQGVTVLGGASMGALRAAECEAFGMIPVGEIAQRYCSGALYDDAAVALSNGPVELGYLPLTEALVDAEATIRRLREIGVANPRQERALLASAASIYFQDRTIEAVCAGADLSPFADAYREHRVRLKARDALALVEALGALPAARATPPEWRMSTSSFWRQRATPRRANGASA
jgi:hypothetical protein